MRGDAIVEAAERKGLARRLSAARSGITPDRAEHRTTFSDLCDGEPK